MSRLAYYSAWGALFRDKTSNGVKRKLNVSILLSTPDFL
jgi:hypothetical protein